MSSKLNRHAYEQLIAEDIEWLMKQPRSLERDHIEAVLRCSPDREYVPDPVKELCDSIRRDIRLCDHGYIHITCGACVAPWLAGGR